MCMGFRLVNFRLFDQRFGLGKLPESGWLVGDRRAAGVLRMDYKKHQTFRKNKVKNKTLDRHTRYDVTCLGKLQPPRGVPRVPGQWHLSGRQLIDTNNVCCFVRNRIQHCHTLDSAMFDLLLEICHVCTEGLKHFPLILETCQLIVFCQYAIGNSNCGSDSPSQSSVNDLGIFPNAPEKQTFFDI